MECIFGGMLKVLAILLLAILGVLYILSPIDIIPDVIPVIGWLDDLGIAGGILKWILGRITKRIAWQVIIIPGAGGFLLWKIHPYLGVCAGTIAFLYGLRIILLKKGGKREYKIENIQNFVSHICCHRPCFSFTGRLDRGMPWRLRLCYLPLFAFCSLHDFSLCHLAKDRRHRKTYVRAESSVQIVERCF